MKYNIGIDIGSTCAKTVVLDENKNILHRLSISSMCTVFAESEVISLIGRGESKENIAFGVVDSIVRKVASQASRLDLHNSAVCLTGGLCDFDYLRRCLAKKLGAEVAVCPDARYAGAIGAALSAAAIRK